MKVILNNKICNFYVQSHLLYDSAHKNTFSIIFLNIVDGCKFSTKILLNPSFFISVAIEKAVYVFCVFFPKRKLAFGKSEKTEKT